MLTFVSAAFYRDPARPARDGRRRDLFWLAGGLALGIPAQGVVGGITVLTDLNPYLVGLHLLLSMVLISLAVWLVRLSRPLDPRPVSRAQALLPRVTLALLWVAVVVGTVLTGSGPHAGDADVPRNGLDAVLLTNLHTAAVFATVAGTLACLVLLRSRAAALLLAVEGAQAGIGIAQYNLGLPIGLVVLHLLGASLAIAAGTNLMLSFRARAEVPADRRRRSGGRRGPGSAARVDEPAQQHLGRTAYPARSECSITPRCHGSGARRCSSGRAPVLAEREDLHGRPGACRRPWHGAHADRRTEVADSHRGQESSAVKSQACLRSLSQRRARRTRATSSGGDPARAPSDGADLVDADPAGEGDVRAPAAVLEPGVRGGPQGAHHPLLQVEQRGATPPPGGPARSRRGAGRRAAGCRPPAPGPGPRTARAAPHRPPGRRRRRPRA